MSAPFQLRVETLFTPFRRERLKLFWTMCLKGSPRALQLPLQRERRSSLSTRAEISILA